LPVNAAGVGATSNRVLPAPPKKSPNIFGLSVAAGCVPVSGARAAAAGGWAVSGGVPSFAGGRSGLTGGTTGGMGLYGRVGGGQSGGQTVTRAGCPVPAAG